MAMVRIIQCLGFSDAYIVAPILCALVVLIIAYVCFRDWHKKF